MNNMYIDIEKIKLEIERLNKVTERLINNFDRIKQENERLKLSWDTKLSEATFLEFQEFYKFVEYLVNKNKSYISYLEKNVKDSYVGLEKNINKNIEENISE